MKIVLLNNLIIQAKEAIKPIGHSSSTLYQYGLAWDELRSFFETNEQQYYLEELAGHFVKNSKTELDNCSVKIWKHKLRRLSVIILNEVYSTGNYQWKYHCQDTNHALDDGFKQVHLLYRSELIRSGKGEGTRHLYETVARQFLIYLQSENVKELYSLCLSGVANFIPYISEQYQATSMRAVLNALRFFLKFLHHSKLSDADLSRAVTGNASRKHAVISTLTRQEENKLLSFIDRSSCIGKRNYAMVLLAMRTGLRSIDIIKLKTSSIDWRSSTISIVQQKNGQPLCLPLFDDVGNALADYMLNARPQSNEPYVFLRNRIPYRKLAGSSACYSISRSVMKNAGIRQSEKESQRKGFHIFRHSLAARMLSQEVPLSVISSTLGHASMSSSKVYLSTDAEHLKACALSLKGIEVAREELL